VGGGGGIHQRERKDQRSGPYECII
jgi:hypothetical protein